jgi:hypothetical protein
VKLANLLTHSTDLARAAGFQQLNIATDLSCAEKSLPSGTLSCNAQRWLGENAELRVVMIESPKIQVISCFVYPHASVALPLYAMELVQLGAKPIVAVIDAVAPAQDPAQSFNHEWLGQARSANADLQNADDPPEWFQECRSGLDFFVRPSDQAEMQRMALLHNSLLMRYLRALPAAARRSALAAGEFEAFARHYKDHHAAHSPGLPLMHKSFGPDWTERFMQQCFFL